MARVIVGMRDYPPAPALLEAARGGHLAGLLWFRSALGETVEGAARRVRELRDEWPPSCPCIFAIDEEGGLIQQLAGLRDLDGSVWPRLPSPRALGRSGDPGDAHAHGREIGRRMQRLGLDLTLAPTVDLDPGPASPVLGTRCFGDDPECVAGLALAWLRGLASAGVRGCLKHFPGHGATTVDSHRELPRVPGNIDLGPHLRPYERIARSWHPEDGPPPAVLTAHIACGGLDLPASLDRNRLASLPPGLGPIVSDSLDMGALSRFGDLEARTRMAFEAGTDLALVGLDTDGGLRLARAVGGDFPKRVSWTSPRTADMRPAWDPVELERVASAGLRALVDVPLPSGAWDWILPEGWGAYGSVAMPRGGAGGNRSIEQLRTYRCDELVGLERALQESSRPCLVGWIHRGREDTRTLEILERALYRVHAVAHLLDGPTVGALPEVWTMETCGFGEGEIGSLERRWREAAAI